MGNRILLADKSITIQKIVQLTFADDNYQIQSVSDGQAALDTISQFKPDLILADISLPLKSGYEVCSTIRTDPQYGEFSAIPVILLAGIYETMDDERARQVEERVRSVDASDFLSKPFDPQLLITKVKQHISGSKSASHREQPVFAQEADDAIHFSENEIAAPPDDGERTMMLPGGPFGNIFADSLPQEDSSHSEPPRRPLDVDNVKPVGEVIFAEEEFPQVELGAEDEDPEQQTVNIQQPSGDVGDAFNGREEQEFEYTDGDMPQMTAPIQFVVPTSEDPFSDVFPDPGQAVPWNASSEEDSPFGVPEPPATPAPAIEPAAEFVESPLTAAPGGKTESIPLEVEGFEDTWPGMKITPPQPVEELFESEVSPVLSEDVEELQPDLSEAAVDESTEESIEPVVTTQQAVASGQFTEELIDRIAERVVNKLSERVVSEIVWQVVPDLAEKMIRRELEKLNAGEE